MNPSLLIAALIVLVTMIFSIQNAQKVQVAFLAWFFEGPLVVVLLITFSAGALVVWLTSIPGRLRRHREIETCRHRDPPADDRHSGENRPH